MEMNNAGQEDSSLTDFRRRVRNELYSNLHYFQACHARLTLQRASLDAQLEQLDRDIHFYRCRINQLHTERHLIGAYLGENENLQ